MTLEEDIYYNCAKNYEKKGEYEKALKKYKLISGCGEVYEKIGEFLYQGQGCEKDKRQAKEYFEKAIEYGIVDAMVNIALCVDDLNEKLECYKKAAEAGNAYAMNMVGIVVEEIDPADKKRACEWFKKAADKGLEIGCYNYAVNVEDPKEKIEYLEKAASKDFVLAMKKYIYYLENGIFCEKDMDKAKKLKEKLKRVQS